MSLEKFQVGGVVLPYPAFLKPLPLAALAGAVFAGSPDRMDCENGRRSSAKGAEMFPRRC